MMSKESNHLSSQDRKRTQSANRNQQSANRIPDNNVVLKLKAPYTIIINVMMSSVAFFITGIESNPIYHYYYYYTTHKYLIVLK